MGRVSHFDYYRDPDFLVWLWEGPRAGDEYRKTWRTPTRRADFPHLSVCVRGAFRQVKPSGASWEMRAGQTSLDLTGEWDEVGVYRWIALEDNSQELCLSALSAGAKVRSLRRVYEAQPGEAIVMDRPGLAVVARGRLETPKGEISNPHFLRIRDVVSLTALEPSRLAFIARP